MELRAEKGAQLLSNSLLGCGDSVRVGVIGARNAACFSAMSTAAVYQTGTRVSFPFQHLFAEVFDYWEQ